jgi:predicted Zn-ribbon and HTH transcriptional regulator
MSENEIFSSNDSLFKKENEMTKKILVGGYDEDLVINKNYLESLDGIYKCNICNKIMINPVECEECGHNFCNDCISSSDCPFGCKTKVIKPSSLAIKKDN